MPDRYNNEAARAAGPDIDDSVPAWAYERIEALEKVLGELHGWTGAGSIPDDLDLRIRTLLDLDPPGFDPATDGP